MLQTNLNKFLNPLINHLKQILLPEDFLSKINILYLGFLGEKIPNRKMTFPLNFHKLFASSVPQIFMPRHKKLKLIINYLLMFKQYIQTKYDQIFKFLINFYFTFFVHNLSYYY